MALRIGQRPAQRKAAFPPSVDAGTRLLILGSLPGDASIKQGEYYAHRGNAFWALVSDLLGEDLRSAPYAMNLDSSIRGAELRDLSAFLSRLPNLRAIAFNGKTAAQHGRRQLGERSDLVMIDLPSSSGAYASLSRDAKRQAWSILAPYVDPT
ncbi:MAG: DNA-deoxyinosine glycosylase [Sphingobium sp.]|nr:MAG: DNA-deoxyinosine glycosylase [Sphingobium sp.]